MVRGLTRGHHRPQGGWKPTEGTPNHFEKLLEGSCPNHAFPINYLYKDCGLMERFLSRGSNKGEHGKDPDPTTDDVQGEEIGRVSCRERV